jgi:hypothetical protein
MLYLFEDIGVASVAHRVYSAATTLLTLGFISSVYPDSVNVKDILLIVHHPIPSSCVTSLHSGMILDNKVLTPSHLSCM